MNSKRTSISPGALVVLGCAILALAGCATSRQGDQHADTPELSRKEREEQSEKRVEAQARYAAGLVYELKRDSDKALDEYVQSVKADPSNEELALEVSRRLLSKKELPRALEIAELATRQPNASAIAFAHLAVLYAEDGRIKDAEQANRKAIGLAPDKLVSYYNLYTLHLNQGDEEKALAVLDEAAKREVNSADYWLDLGELYANFLRTKPTKKDLAVGPLKVCLDRADKLGVEGPLRHLKLADGYALTGETTRAVDILLDVLDKNPDDARIRDLSRQKLLALYISSEDTEGALAQLESMVHDHPTNAQANFLLASVAYEKKDLQKAAGYFRKTLKLNPDFEQAYYSLTPVLLELDLNDEAADLLATAREKFPDSFIAHYFSAVVFARQDNHAKAVEHYTRAEIIAKATSPGRLDHLFYFQMGAQQERNQQFEEAAATFKKALDLKPDFAPALNYLGYMWADRGTNLEDARKLIQKAVDLEPRNAAYLDSLAWVLYKLDQPNLALTYMEDAVKYQEEPDATLFDHLGDIQKAAGQLDEARKSWTKSIEITPDPEIQKKLDHPEPASEKSEP